MRRAVFLVLLTSALTTSTMRAQNVDVPVRNWTIPPYTGSPARGGITTMTDVTNPAIFVSVAPCRLADTRGIDGFSGQAAGPPLSSFTNRNFQITGSPGGVPGPPNGCPGGTIPSGADAVSIQFTVVTPTAAGNLVGWQAGGSTPSVSVLNWDTGTVAQGSGTIVPLGPGGAFTLRLNTAAVGQTAHLVIDVNGYFGSTLGNPFSSFGLTNNSGNATAYFTNESLTCSSGCAVDGYSYSQGQGKAIQGRVHYLGNNSAGVYGAFQSGLTGLTFSAAGVRGESPALGVLGIGNTVGTAGTIVAPGTGAYLAEGYLGYHTVTFDYGVYSAGRTGASGTKSFVDPHPTDPSKVIRYVSLEGNEPGTYFRGRGKFERGMARIPVPEDFRLVTDEEGLTVQVTAIGAMATVGVIRMSLTEIVVESSRNVEFSYLVQGVRTTQKDSMTAIAAGTEFMPKSADATIPAYLSEEQKRRLIQNGTYREDGTVNPETARRLGWDRVWAERERPTPARSPD